MNADIVNLFDQLDQDTIILTPNRRLSADLLEQYCYYNNSRKNHLWKKPDILPINAWINRLWSSYVELSEEKQPMVLSEEQELIIWEKIIKSSVDDILLFNYLESARSAKDTNDLINQWNIPIEEIDPTYSVDCKQFTKWLEKFKLHLNNNFFVESSAITNQLNDNLTVIRNLLPKKIIFAFFDEFIPSINILRNKLEHLCDISTFETSLCENKHYRYIAKDTEEELIDLVCWARDEYLQKKSKIACVVTDLASNRNRIERIAKEYLHDNNVEIPYDISAGKSLIDYPIIATIFQILSVSNTIPINTATDIIKSPFIKAATKERTSRMLLIQQINSMGVLDIELKHILLLSKDETANYFCPVLSAILEDIHNHKLNLKKYEPSNWINEITKMIYMAGWPGEDIISSEEFQAFKKFENILTKFSTLDHVIEEITFHKAISTLENFTIRTEFQIQSPKTPIQFLGLLEASGRIFDSIWVTNVTSTNWPQAKSPNSFIPIPLQLKYNLPHSSYERELEFSLKLTNRFVKSANLVIFSYGEMQGDLAQYTSPLISDFPRYQKEIQNNSIYLNQRLMQCFEYYNDDKAPPISKKESPKGGSEIIRHQSECPFKAFARFRLELQPQYAPMYGINYLQRGILMHYCLEKVWKKIQSSQQLHLLKDEELSKLVSTYINVAINTKLPPWFLQYHHKLIQLEKERLTKLIVYWLNFEKNRKAFTCISTEKNQKLKLKNISMDLRVDRIDRVQQDYVIIDYKSTTYAGLDWFSDRPDSPQLLIYLISSELPISALVFAQIKSGKALFRGLSNIDIGIDGVTINDEISTKQAWEQQKNKWEKIIVKLIDDFNKGKSELDPKYTTTCQGCNYNILCRINDQEYI